MEPATAEATICQGHKDAHGCEMGVPLGLVGRVVLECADTGILLVDEVDEIR